MHISSLSDYSYVNVATMFGDIPDGIVLIIVNNSDALGAEWGTPNPCTAT